MDTSNIKKVMETDSADSVNRMLSEGWVLLSSAGGQADETKRPYILYSMGSAHAREPNAKKVGVFG